ncbi:MAG TPA: iron ABC transporter permease [Candidatus Limnocylindrales bacterium]|nr:iron ABC transporter permease [Candidatus Limnocylindrales bacterium]
MSVFRREPRLGLVVLLLTALMAVFILLPQVSVVLAPGVAGYAAFFREGPNWLLATRNSLVVMVLSTTTAVILGFLYAYAMVYSRMPWKPFFRIVGILPLLSPPFVVAASYVLLFGPRGLVTYGIFGASPNVLGLAGLWGVQTIAFFPYAYQLIADVLARSDPRLEQAARNLGAGPLEVFRTVTFPLARPGLVGAVLLVAIYVLEDFGNPALIGGQYTVLPTLAYGLITGFGDLAGAAVVSTILLVLALTLYVGRLRLEGRGSVVTVSGRGSSIPRPPVPRAVTWACFAICLVLAGLILMVYGVLVLSAFVSAFPFDFSPTLKHFGYVGAHATSLRNSLVYASSAAVACAFFAVLLAYVVQRREWSGRRVVDFVAIAPAAVPGIFFGIGYATTFNQAWLGWLDRGALITLSMIFWNIPVGYRAAVASLQQIDRSIDEAATSLGASSLQAFRHVLFPLLGGAFATGVITAFVRAITTLSVVIFLFTPSTVVTTITIFQLVNDFNWGGAAAFTVSVVGMAVVIVTILTRLTGRRVRLEVASA